MAEMPDDTIINWPAFDDARSLLGADLIRILGYFREDGLKAIDAIERAMHQEDARQLVLPAHKLKGEAAQFGADKLSELAEHIEDVSRRCVEHRESPDELLAHVVELRAMFERTIAVLEMETSPLVQRRTGSGRGSDHGGFNAL